MMVEFFSQGSFCLVRILCLRQISLMEESVGEKVTRFMLFCFSICVAILNCTALIFSGDISSGTVFNMITRQMAQSGTVKPRYSRYCFRCTRSQIRQIKTVVFCLSFPCSFSVLDVIRFKFNYLLAIERSVFFVSLVKVFDRTFVKRNLQGPQEMSS